jgi:hypothetical protein
MEVLEDRRLLTDGVYSVASLDDGSINDVGTLRWAIDQANGPQPGDGGVA